MRVCAANRENVWFTWEGCIFVTSTGAAAAALVLDSPYFRARVCVRVCLRVLARACVCVHTCVSMCTKHFTLSAR